MGLWTSWAALLLLFFLGSGFVAPRRIAAREPKPVSVAPAWKTDLHPAVAGEPLGYRFRAAYEAELPASTSIWFADNATVMATFVIRANREGTILSRPDEPATSPFRLRAIFVNATTGRIKAAVGWPSDARDASVVAAHDGGFVTQRGARVDLYGTGPKELKQIRLPPGADWRATPSPDGKSILFSAFDPRSRTNSWLWIDTGDLSIRHSWEGQPDGGISIADESIALSTWCTQADCPPAVLEVRGPNTGWKVIGRGDAQPYFVDDDALFLPSYGTASRPAPAKLLRTDGHVLLSEGQPAPGGVWWSIPAVSAGGKRFVSLGVRTEGAHPALDMGGHSVLRRLLVYDLLAPGHEQVLEVKGPKIEDVYDPRNVALSPDGTRLAILNKEVVYMLNLPPLPEEADASAPKHTAQVAH